MPADPDAVLRRLTDGLAELVALQARVEHAFSSVRGRTGDREVANNELDPTAPCPGCCAAVRRRWSPRRWP